MDNGSKGNMYHGTNEIYLNNLCIFKFVNSNITIFFILLLKFFFKIMFILFILLLIELNN